MTPNNGEMLADMRRTGDILPISERADPSATYHLVVYLRRSLNTLGSEIGEPGKSNHDVAWNRPSAGAGHDLGGRTSGARLILVGLR